MSDMKYPLNKKLALVGDLSHVISEFLEWLEEQKGLAICEPYKPQFAWYIPSHASKEKLVMEFFGIDLEALEKEKRQMLEESSPALRH
jgi:hypothetical protein